MKEIKEFIIKYKFMILVIGAITLIFLFVVPLIINCIVTSKFNIQFITPNNQDAWIGFYGAIIGGGVTLGGVAWTIVEQRKQLKKQKIDFEEQRKNDLINQERQRREDLAIRYKPFLLPISNKVLDASCLKTDVQPSNPIYDNEDHEVGTDYYITHTADILIEIKNGGRGEALISSIDIESGWNPTTNAHVSVAPNFEKFINPDGFLKLILHINLYNYDSFTASLGNYYDYSISIKYTDFLESTFFNRDLSLYIMNSAIQEPDGTIRMDEESGLPKAQFSIIIQ